MKRALPVLAGLLCCGTLAHAQEVVRSKPSERLLHLFRGAGSGALPGSGYSVASAGDVDGDGIDDLIVGAPFEGASNDGRAKVYSGASGDLVFPPLSHAAGRYLGFSVAGIGDLDGDGHAEVLVGDPMFGSVGPGGTGQAFVFSGADGSLVHHVLGDGSSDELGASVAGIGDVDGDGVGDFAVGATEDHDFSPGPGYVRLYSGTTAATIRTYTVAGVGRRFGQSLADAGDVDGDGVHDLAIGASGGVGTVQMRSGATGALLWQVVGPSSSSSFGWDLDLAGDVDGSGSPDLVVGAPGASLARVLRATDGAQVYDVLGPTGDFFGGAVAGLGDVDRDGFADLAIGAKWADSPATTFSGAAWILSGRDRRVLGGFFGGQSGDRVGFALASIGDLEGDGVRELAFGAPQEVNPGPGFAAVYSGRRAVGRPLEPR